MHFFGIHEGISLRDPRLRGADEGAAMRRRSRRRNIALSISARPSRWRCLVNGLWLCCSGELRYAVLLTFYRECSRRAVLRIELAVPAGAAGNCFAQRVFAELEAAVDGARSYRWQDPVAGWWGRLSWPFAWSDRASPADGRPRCRDPPGPDAAAAQPQRTRASLAAAICCASWASRPARASCSTARPAPARPTPFAISPPACPATPR